MRGVRGARTRVVPWTKTATAAVPETLAATGLFASCLSPSSNACIMHCSALCGSIEQFNIIISWTFHIAYSETCSPFMPWPSKTAKNAQFGSSLNGYVTRPRSWFIFAKAVPFAPGFCPCAEKLPILCCATPGSVGC